MSTLSALHAAVHVLLSNLFYRLPEPHDYKSLADQTIIVTGSNVGLGYELSRHYLRLGVGKLIMAVRNETKGETARQTLLSSTGRSAGAAEVWLLDMDNYDSVKVFAARAASLPRLDGVCANAGLAPLKFTASAGAESGLEQTLNVNVVSTFLLFFLLLPAMRASEQSTGVRPHFSIPNSALHYTASVKELTPRKGTFARLSDPKQADMPARYPLSKLLVLWIVREAASRGVSMPVLNTPNPSFCQSELMRDYDVGPVTRFLVPYLARTTEVGSRALWHGMTAGETSHGQYLTNCHVQSPAHFVNNAEGQLNQKHVFEELVETLEEIQPGVTSSLTTPQVAARK
ncbi:uncharacterized protein HMPREF1541_05173 [Cyphellophora europaea CBS 101466]|uniref:Ketoreductase (KR) domain-containing protein n=1 Tax=Cyphellophora europaea (strain CBS 101466) TaxID=1220924 RepID=W2RYP8_CYPE1|nr:uncharacterized protein HMPREF1541_05173 [Cyphellophora europaea CBS 101466]ETN40893.1 hypothetical protein HMPREF1541_05173 [Cyphellophora europaea CBS 101466]